MRWVGVGGNISVTGVLPRGDSSFSCQLAFRLCAFTKLQSTQISLRWTYVQEILVHRSLNYIVLLSAFQPYCLSMLGVWGGVVGGSMRSDISVSGVESFGIDLLALSIDTALNFEQDDIGNWTLNIGH